MFFWLTIENGLNLRQSQLRPCHATGFRYQTLGKPLCLLGLEQEEEQQSTDPLVVNQSVDLVLSNMSL